MTSVPPISLKNLYDDLDFLGGIKDKQKYSFSKRYYSGLGWADYFWRRIDGENQDINGIAAMESICTNASQQWDVYKNHDVFGSQLLDKMVSARHGLQRCVNTHDSLQKTVSSSSIKNRSILLLDNAIPYERKVREGIILVPDTSDGVKRVLFTALRNSPETRDIESYGSTSIKSVSSSPIISNLHVDQNLVEEDI